MKAVFLFFVLALGFVVPAIGAHETGFSDTKGEGKALVQDLLTRGPAESTEILGLIIIRPPDKEPIEIPIKMTTHAGSNSWQEIYQTQPVLGRPAEVLVVKHFGLRPNEYLFGTTTNAATPAELSAISGDRLYQPLAGSDFYFADLGLEFLHWPAQKIVKKEMRKGRSCRVVESINPKPTPASYSKVLSWMDFETGGIIQAEGYDSAGKLLKEFSIRKVDRSEKRIKEIQMRNDQTDSRTRLEFSLKIEDPLTEQP